MKSPRSWPLVVCFLAISCAAAQSTAPIYNEKANAANDISAAIAKAGHGNKNVVLIFGANW